MIRSTWRSKRDPYRQFPPIFPCWQHQWYILHAKSRREKASAGRKGNSSMLAMMDKQKVTDVNTVKHTGQCADRAMLPQRH